MTRWKWDAEPNDPLNEYRIPVTAYSPLHSYIACFHTESPQRPTEREARMIRAFIDEHLDYWCLGRDVQEMRNKQPFDTELGRNPVILHKYDTNDWGYRRSTWQLFPLFTPPSRGRTQGSLGPLSLVELLDLIHDNGTGQEQHWRQWKADHPDVFGEVAA